jgi:hypothetical protein
MDVDHLLDSASLAPFGADVDTDRALARTVRRGRSRRRRRLALAALGAVVAVVGAGAGAARLAGSEGTDRFSTAGPGTSDAPGGSAPLPEFLSAPGWETSQTGLLATAANVPLGPDAQAGNFPAHETIRRLQAGDVLIQAAFIAPLESWEDDAVRGFPPRELPLSLDEATPHTSFEGSLDVWADRLGATVNGWNIDVLVFYGGTDLTSVPPVGPTTEARAAGQEQLARLVVPAPP